MKNLCTYITIFEPTTGEIFFDENKTYSSESEFFLRCSKVLESFKRGVWKHDNLTVTISLMKEGVPQQTELF